MYSKKLLLTDDPRMQFINLGNYDTYDIYISIYNDYIATNDRNLTALETIECIFLNL